MDGASLGLFRILFGAMMVLSAARFYGNGWIERLYLRPAFHFSYYGFDFVRILSPTWMYGLFGLWALSALAMACGIAYRFSTLLFLISFSYIQLIDKTTYLNHYYFVAILSALMLWMPLDSAFSLSKDRQKSPYAAGYVPRWALWTLRMQVGLVYFFAGVAKLKGDWLIHGEPLHLWLTTHRDVPWVGPMLATPEVALAMAWAGMLFDLCVPVALLYPRTRALAYVGVLAFHLITGLLFPIGLFPVIMAVAASVFFAPDWPRRFTRRSPLAPSNAPAGQRDDVGKKANTRRLRIGLCVLSLHFAAQCLIPLRHHLYPGNTCWSEEGYRYAWHVMLTDKTGVVDFLVRDKRGHSWTVHPRDYLTPLQIRMMSTQPDMILQFAQYLGAEFERRSGGPVEVRAEAHVSMNALRSGLLVDPEVDLMKARDSLAPQSFIMPQPETRGRH